MPDRLRISLRHQPPNRHVIDTAFTGTGLVKGCGPPSYNGEASFSTKEHEIQSRSERHAGRRVGLARVCRRLARTVAGYRRRFERISYSDRKGIGDRMSIVIRHSLPVVRKVVAVPVGIVCRGRAGRFPTILQTHRLPDTPALFLLSIHASMSSDRQPTMFGPSRILHGKRPAFSSRRIVLAENPTFFSTSRSR